LAKRSKREPVHPEQRLIVTLKYLATGNTLRSLAFDFFLGEWTVRSIVNDTCKAIHQELLPLYVPFPSTQMEWTVPLPKA
ncbi:nuclease HARBI1-like protein, partial [Aphelenchoides avenae]